MGENALQPLIEPRRLPRSRPRSATAMHESMAMAAEGSMDVLADSAVSVAWSVGLRPHSQPDSQMLAIASTQGRQAERWDACGALVIANTGEPLHSAAACLKCHSAGKPISATAAREQSDAAARFLHNSDKCLGPAVGFR